MDPRLRIVVAILVAMSVAGLALLLLVKNANKPESRLEMLITEFMECLPEETTDAQREEIHGIMTRFHDRAMDGSVSPQDIVAIENDLTTYIDRGQVAKSELFEFMSKVGNATRKMGSNP